ncbi:putative cell survival pathways protein [Lunasporangiospora selenospora]|uniref:Cell survival pathways protein n=1 Tax=Lunasporangiospora selenospora TaxID=979761 RepID=A0A9P6G214_9FUNG|nr:putative cell survival pathways protein [Lunasporangiospora selenospora]
MWSSLTSSVSSLAGYNGQSSSPKPGDVPGAGEGVKTAASLCKDEKYFTELTTKDLEWTIAPTSSTETQTFYYVSDEGYFGHIQLIHSNLGIWGVPASIQMTARFRGNGINKLFSVNLAKFELTPDKLSVTTDKITIKLSPDGKSYSISVSHAPELIISLTFEKVATGFMIGEGKTFFGDGYVSHKFWPSCKVSGMVLVDGKANELTGEGTLIHAVQGMRPHLVASKWNYVDFVGKDTVTDAKGKLCLMQYTTPEYYGAVTVTQGSLTLNGELIAVSVENRAEFVTTALDEETGYNPPTEVNYIWEGKTLGADAKPFKAVLNVKPRVLCQKVDLLSEMPWALRKAVSAFVAKPIIYQWLDEASATVKIGDKEQTLAGKIYHESTFVM